MEVQKAISSTFKSTAHLANLLPTGTVLVFQLLSPIFTNHGECDSVTTRSMSYALVILCGASCFILTFTDTVRDGEGKISHGLATFNGLWVLDGPKLAPEVASKYRIQFIDFLHAMMSILVFLAIAMFDRDVVHCFWPKPSREMREVLTMLPLAIGVSCSLLFVAFPTQRHGVGFPLSTTPSEPYES